MALLLVLLLLLLSQARGAFDPSVFTVQMTTYSGEISYDKRTVSTSGRSPAALYTFIIVPNAGANELPAAAAIGSTDLPIAARTKCLSISFVFKQLNMPSAELRIFDQSPINTVFTCVSCQSGDRLTGNTIQDQHGSYMPPLFNSTTGSVAVAVFGTSDTTQSSFTLSYTCANVMYTTAQESSSYNVALNLNTGYGTVRPILSTHFYTENLISKWVPVLTGVNTKQTFTVRSPERWYYNTASSSWVYDGSLTQSYITFSVTLINWPAALCQSGYVFLKIYNSAFGGSSIYDACMNSASVNPSNAWIKSEDKGVIRVELINNTPASSNGGGDLGTQLDFAINWYTDSDLWECGEQAQPDTIVAKSWKIVDGSQGYDSSESGGLQRTAIGFPRANCQWLLSPVLPATQPRATLTLIFRWVSLKPGSRVVVYDNSAASGTILWDSGSTFYDRGFQGLSRTTPPPLVSSGPSLFVVYSTDPRSGTSFFGFAGEYMSNYPRSIGMGSGQSLLSMSSAIDITPPGAANGSFYAPGLTYQWSIDPRIAIGGANLNGGPITFAFSELDLPAGDTLSLYDGSSPNNPPNNLIGVFTGSQTPYRWFTTKSNKASMVFSSSASSKGRGVVKVSYFTDGPNFHCGFSLNPAKLTAASMVFTDGSYSGESLYSNQRCHWTIAPGGGAQGVFITFSRFQVFGGRVNIYDGPVESSSSKLLVSISETASVPAPVLVTTSSVVGVEYVTRNGATGQGFNATYFGIYKKRPSEPGDGVIKIYSSSMQDLQGLSFADLLFQNHTTTYLIRPVAPVSNSTSLFFSVAQLNLTDYGLLEVFDGDFSHVNASAPNYTLPGWLDAHRLLSLSGRSTALPNKWIKTSGPAATVRITTAPHRRSPLAWTGANGSSHSAQFGMSYFSDAPSTHCGFPANPGLLTAPSMVFTDGSSSIEPFYTAQNCAFAIAPVTTAAVAGAGTTAGAGGVVVIEFLAMDLRGGGQLAVYEGPGDVASASTTSLASRLLWQCSSCSTVPRPLLTHAGGLFVTFTSSSSMSSTSRGSGFKAVYWTLNGTSASSLLQATSSLSSAPGAVLEMPLGYSMSSSRSNRTTSWRLGLGQTLEQAQTSKAILRVFPRYTATATANHTRRAWDGRPGNSSLDSLGGPAPSCGFVQDVAGAGRRHALYAVNSSLFMLASQAAQAYQKTSIGDKMLYNVAGSTDTTTTFAADPLSLLFAASTCKYTIDSATTQSVVLTVKSFNQGGDGDARLVILGGVLGNDAMLFDSQGQGGGGGGGSVSNLDLVAPCGVATIILSSSSSSSPQHSLELSYGLNPQDNGMDCYNYKQSLLPKIKKPDPLIPLYIALGALGMCCLSCVVFYHIRRLVRRYWPQEGFLAILFQRMRTYRVVTPRHLRYRPKLDEARNRLLPRGKCCVCQEPEVQVFRLDCRHGLCMECIRGYLTSALGDISMFPVKCPLHYEGCTGTIGAKISKRVLTRPMFDKFNEFTDRMLYGEGMRCIYCDNFVNFPVEGAISMVECPYCIQQFCMRCKKGWHFGSRCPLDKVDDSLDDWREQSQAQRCPCCRKLIEKDDPNTCNHMVHKITDGIPCLRDRTDFCYLCGAEVLPDYPHEEVRNPGINHFPDGVFQTCRTVAQREREAERDRLRRLRRKTGGGHRKAERGVQQFGFGVLGADENNPEYEEHQWSDDEGEEGSKWDFERGGGGGDAFDMQWDAALRHGGPGGGGGRGRSHSSPNRTAAASPSPPHQPSRAPSASPPSSRPTSHQGQGSRHASRVSPMG